jgi:hypothetical protein
MLDSTILSILYYYACSISLIVYNKWLFTSYDFHYPLFVTSFHFLCSFLALGCFSKLKFGCLPQIPKRTFLLSILPLGFVIGADISLSNLSYLFLDIPILEIVKSASPLWILLVAFITGAEQRNLRLVATILLIAIGLSLSVYADATVHPLGVVLCSIASILAAIRAVIIQILTQPSRLSTRFCSSPSPLSPLQILFFSSPVVLFVMAPASYLLEARRLVASPFALNPLTPSLLIAAGSILAVNLNLSELILIKATSAITTAVIAVAKILLVTACSALLFHTHLSLINALGMIVCLAGIVLYKNVRAASTERAAGYAGASAVDGDELEILVSAEKDYGATASGPRL